MSIDELKEDEWFKTRPEVIQQAILKCPPTQMWKFKSNGKQCTIYAYDEPESGLLEDVTLTVQKTGIGGPMCAMGLGSLDRNRVFGVSFEDLEPYEEESC